jgi:hypothetical protein
VGFVQRFSACAASAIVDRCTARIGAERRHAAGSFALLAFATGTVLKAAPIIAITSVPIGHAAPSA